MIFFDTMTADSVNGVKGLSNALYSYNLLLMLVNVALGKLYSSNFVQNVCIIPAGSFIVHSSDDLVIQKTFFAAIFWHNVKWWLEL